MAQIKAHPLGGNFGGFTPYGNVTSLVYLLQTNAAGVPFNSNAAGALAVDDVVSFGFPLEAGFRVDDMQLIVSDAFDASVTCDIGFTYCDGEDDAAMPQAADYFGAGLALSAVARLAANPAKKLMGLPKEAYLTVTIKGADVASAGTLQVLVTGERLGSTN